LIYCKGGNNEILGNESRYQMHEGG